jgi:hypothetical protein
LAVLTFQLESGLQDQLERWSQVKTLQEFVINFDHVIFAVKIFLILGGLKKIF